MKRYLIRFLDRLVGVSKPSWPLGSAGAGMMFYTFLDAAGKQKVQPRDWIFFRDAAGNLTRQPRPTIERRDAAGNVYWEPVWMPAALQLTTHEYLHNFHKATS